VILEIKDRYSGIGLGRLCWLLGITRQAYYQHYWRSESKSIAEELVLQQVLTIRSKHPRMGGRKLFSLLKPFMLEHQIKMGRDGLFNLLEAKKLLVKIKRRHVRTTQSNHWLRKYPNLIKGYTANGPNELWVSDITYLRTKNGFLYISFITDSFSHKVVGYNIADNMESLQTRLALKMAVEQYEGANKKLIHHSDRGSQYCCTDYVNLLNKNGISISMTESGDPLENALAERINGIIKEEYLDFYQIMDLNDAKRHLQNAVQLYNNERPHMSIGMLTPENVHVNNLQTENLWKKARKVISTSHSASPIHKGAT